MVGLEECHLFATNSFGADELCPFLSARGADIYEAAELGNVSAVRHFLHVDPESLERKDEGDGRSLRTEEGDPCCPCLVYFGEGV